ncbi:MAG TPA: ABC transporter, partial [Firmicutes bacterium]|nr:ABC transporter [Bacillota bacterium]
MSRTVAIFKREFASYFNSPIAYIYVTVFLGLAGWLFFKGFFLVGEASMRTFFGLLP